MRDLLAAGKIGTLTGSMLSALLGTAVLLVVLRVRITSPVAPATNPAGPS